MIREMSWQTDLRIAEPLDAHLLHPMPSKLFVPGFIMTRLRSLSFSSLISTIVLVIAAWQVPAAWGGDSVRSFRPISPEELKMTNEPAAPGAPAVILYRNVYRDDSSGQNGDRAFEDDYVRIKILTEEGRKYGDVEILYDKDLETIVGLHARTIKPDGSVADFDGKVFTKTVVKGLGLKYMAKTFTLPAVQVGSILEYYYTIDLSEDVLVSSNWIMSHELFTKSGDFALKPYTTSYADVRVRWTWQNMPEGAPQAKQGGDGVVRLHVANVEAFPTEDFMPPENEMKARVDFSYTEDEPETDPVRYWSKLGKKINTQVENYVGRPKSLQDALDGIVAESDPPEVKLQKIYTRVQQLRNTTYEVEKTDQEKKRTKEKDLTNAREVWKRGYGDRDDITLLYLALVRAAGLDAQPIILADRANYFFNPNLMQGGRLDAFIVVVNVNGKKIFCDPGAAYTPFGLLPWSRTGLQGLQLDKKEPVWVTTLATTPEQARVERKANLTLSEAGDLEGKLTVTYFGLEAARARVDERNVDETARRKYLEDTIKGFVPVACEVKLTNQPGWKSSDTPLVAEVDLKVPGWASGAGRHMLVPAALFGGNEKQLFVHAERIYPIYSSFPNMESDDLNIQLPAGWTVSSLPAGWKDSGKVVTYNLSAEKGNDKLHLTRTLTVGFILLDKKYYGALRHYYQEIKNTDEQQIVLDPAAAHAGN
jgi:hypothetical protein